MVLVSLMRIKHWIKNLFVFAPIIFSANIGEFHLLVNTIYVFISFCFVSSSIYIFNDIKDADNDSKHPRKKNRPIVSGKISINHAVIIAFLCLILGIAFLFFLPFYASLSVILYILLNVFYNIKGKDLVLIDAICISIGFVLRVIAGAYAINVNPTGWIIVTTFFLALFLGFGKRRNELIQSKSNKNNTRKVLELYNFNYLDYLMISTATITIISYSLYCLDSQTVQKFGTDKLIYTIPFVSYGVFRYLLLIFRQSEGDPTEIVYRDLGISLTLVFWIVTFLSLIHFSV
jgi:4-hydroxybenzoate polyprenyltransferase